MPKFSFGSLNKKSEKILEKKNISDSQDEKITPGEKEIKLGDLKPPKKQIKQVPKSDIPQELTSKEIYNVDFNKICINLAQDLDYQRSVIKAFRNALPQIFGGIKTRVSKEEMSKEFNERVKTHFDMTTPLLNEMRKESDLFKKQKSKHNK